MKMTTTFHAEPFARFREVIVDHAVQGYVENTARGRKAADEYVLDHAKRSGTHRPVARIPQGARRLDR